MSTATMRRLPVARKLQAVQPPSMPSAGASPASTKRQAVKKPSLTLILVLGIPCAVMALALMIFVAGVALQEYGQARSAAAVKTEAAQFFGDFASRDSEAVFAEMGLRVPPIESVEEPGG